MSRKKQPRWSVRFELAPENTEDVKLHEFLDKLAENNEVSAWIRKTLAAAVPAQVEQDTQLAQDDEDEQVEPLVTTTPAPPYVYGHSIIEDLAKMKTVDVTASKTPAEILAERRKLGKQKHPTPPSLNGGRK